MKTLFRMKTIIALCLLCSAGYFIFKKVADMNKAGTSQKEAFDINQLKIDYLADHPEWIPILAKWTYAEWHQYDPTLTIEKTTASIKTRLNKDKIPVGWVATYKGKPIGMVSLKEAVHVPNVPEGKIWLGSFYVDAPYRNKGVGKKLLAVIYKKAVQLGYSEIYLYTSDPTMPPYYQKNGWELIGTRPFLNHTVTLMHWQTAKDKK